MLQNIEVLEAEKIRLLWGLRLSGRIIYSRLTDGQVALSIKDQSNDEKSLVIHMINEYGALAEGFVPSQLIQLLAEFCGIWESQKIALLAQILTQNNLKLIELDLKQCGVNDDENGYAESNYGKPQAERPELEKLENAGLTTTTEDSMETEDAESTEDETNKKNEKKASNEEKGKKIASLDQVILNEDDIAQPGGKKDNALFIKDQKRGFEKLRSVSSGSESPSSSEDYIPWMGTGAKDYDKADLQRRSSETSERGFMSMSQGVFSTPSSFADGQAVLNFLQVSRFLTSFLDSESYNPERDWTSPMRQRHGHGVYVYRADDSTFRIQEKGRGKLRAAVMQKNGLGDDFLPDSCTFHIQVCATNAGRDALFKLSISQYMKAKLMRLQADYSDVYIIARVFSVLNNDPGIALYVDPWGLHERGHITLEPTAAYVGSIQLDTPALLEVSRAITDLGASGTDIYRDLPVDGKHIRLLELEIDNEAADNIDKDNAPLRAKLVCLALQPPQTRFWAISYVWGTKDGHVIEVNGTAMPITDSLWACLKQLRARHRVTGDRVPVWADAICINQKDDIEKAMQVRRMGIFYSKADKVVIWAGNETSETCGALQSLDQWNKMSQLQNAEIHTSSDTLHSPPREDAARINALLECPWFTRAWTIQELVFGSQVVIMSNVSELPWQTFIGGVISSGQRLPNIHADAALALNATRRYYNGRTPVQSGRRGGGLKYSFLELIELFFYAQSTHQRDRLFSLLNLAYDTTVDKEGFYPDYSNLSDPNHDVVILSRYAKAFVEDNHALNLLHHAGSGRSSRFCTWIPDFFNEHNQLRYAPTISSWSAAGPSSCSSEIQVSGAEQHAFCADRFPSQAYVLEVPPTSLLSTQNYDIPVLAIMGRLVDTVQTCGMHIDSKSIHFSNTLRDFHNILSPLNGYPHWDPSTSKGSWKDKRNNILVRCLIGDAAGPHVWLQHRNYFFRNDASQGTGTPPLATSTSPAERWPAGYQSQILQVPPGSDGWTFLSKNEHEKRTINSYWKTVAAFTERIQKATDEEVLLV
ncbi:het domain containing protein [Grosmannia clavigera kw1407]|uniref:Het domain containing protein n=1 Tax=Grosmannia clavigera (strain kw1407 / UAMH 11150) TaxID=655863 RepID=F0X778_GROCL|nr:het domain containing protein [Grosmannia clavigera kw1407]EFX06511.1 het domain containing protein [Grosmannia clavigera kw1407]